MTINGGVYCCLKFNPACCKTIILIVIYTLTPLLRILGFISLVLYFMSFLCSATDVFEDAKAKARSFRIKATYAYEILHD